MTYSKGKDSMKQQGVTLLDYLSRHPDSSAKALTRELISKHGPRASYVHLVIAEMRNVLGDEVIPCKYDRPKRSYVYRLAIDRQQGFEYIMRRKVKVKNEANNLINILDRIEKKWPGDYQVAWARMALDMVVQVLSQPVPSSPGTLPSLPKAP